MKTIMLSLLIALTMGCRKEPFPEKEVSFHDLSVRIPTHWSARKVTLRFESPVEVLFVSDDRAIPVDKYFKAGEFPGRLRIMIREIGQYSGTFPTPEGATGAGSERAFGTGVIAREWIYHSPSRHEIGTIRTVMVATRGHLYSIHCGSIDRKDFQLLIDRMISSLKTTS